MAVHAANGTLTASTVATTTLTSWRKSVAYTVGASPAGTVWVTTDGSTPTVGGADCIPVASGTTVVLKNLSPRPQLSTTTDTTGTFPSAVPAFTTSQTVIKAISSVAAVWDAELVEYPGAATVRV
jgi:hypothetical protein